MSLFTSILRREQWRLGASLTTALLPAGFFLLAASLFPIAVGGEPEMVTGMAPAVIWVVLLLSILLSVPELFQPDWEDGTMDQWRLSGQPFWQAVLARNLAHWLLAILPALLLSLPVAIMQLWPLEQLLRLFGTLLLGSIALQSLAGALAALLAGLPRPGLLLLLMLLPLASPILIFGVGASSRADITGEGDQFALLMLAALTLVYAPLGMVVASWILKSEN